MDKILRIGIMAGALMVLSVGPVHAVLTFRQLDQDTFTVSHRVKGFGSRGKATELVYTKTASLCIAAGYTHYQVRDQESQASQPYRAANATVTVRFFQQDGEDRIACEPGSDPEYVEDARAKLQEMGYEPPDRGEANEAARSAAEAQSREPSASCPDGCTIEQIPAMARAGLTDEQIRAACDDGSDEVADKPEN